MSIFALVSSRGSTKLAIPFVCAKAAAAQGNRSVEFLLPKGGRRL
jgi:predicted peroxiredoxin